MTILVPWTVGVRVENPPVQSVFLKRKICLIHSAHYRAPRQLYWLWPQCLVFSYLIAQGVCYLTLCEASFPKKMAFAYLEDLHSEFYDQYGRRVPSVTRPYSFIEFGKTALFVVHSRNIISLINSLEKEWKLWSSLLYTYIVLDTYIQKTKKSYIDSRARRNLGSINTELQDVQRIMVANIEEVLQRGEALSGKYSCVFKKNKYLHQEHQVT